MSQPHKPTAPPNIIDSRRKKVLSVKHHPEFLHTVVFITTYWGSLKRMCSCSKESADIVAARVIYASECTRPHQRCRLISECYGEAPDCDCEGPPVPTAASRIADARAVGLRGAVAEHVVASECWHAARRTRPTDARAVGLVRPRWCAHVASQGCMWCCSRAPKAASPRAVGLRGAVADVVASEYMRDHRS